LAGVVTALGYGTTGLSIGQRVFGLTDWYRDGTLAEYVAVEARNLAPPPGDVDFTEGAALVMPGLTAWQGLFEQGRLRVGQSVLVHGALPAVRPLSTSARRRSSTSITTPWKMSAGSIWFSMSSAATSRSGPQA
jgi:NADPH-dependent curcumin reductase CurA